MRDELEDQIYEAAQPRWLSFEIRLTQ
jgi:hypothetical protein